MPRIVLKAYGLYRGRNPTLIEIKTVIGYGSPNKSGKSDIHGAPLGADELKLTKEFYGWDHEPFQIPDEVYETFKAAAEVQGVQAEAEWNAKFESYQKEYPELAKQFVRAMNNELPEDFDAEIPVYEAGKSVATRSSSGDVINALAKN
jgi:transketolase